MTDTVEKKLTLLHLEIAQAAACCPWTLDISVLNLAIVSRASFSFSFSSAISDITFALVSIMFSNACRCFSSTAKKIDNWQPVRQACVPLTLSRSALTHDAYNPYHASSSGLSVAVLEGEKRSITAVICTRAFVRLVLYCVTNERMMKNDANTTPRLPLRCCPSLVLMIFSLIVCEEANGGS